MAETDEPRIFLAEQKAGGLLLRHDITTPGFNIVALAKVLKIEVVKGGLEHVDAWLLRRDDGTGVIRVSDTIPDLNRQRFSIAHELGHWILHEGRSQGYLCTAKDLRDYTHSPEEIEANLFAASLLIPRNFISPSALTSDPNFNEVENLANTCKTSLTSAARRLVELSKKKVILVCSWNGAISWFLPNKSVPWLNFDKRVMPAKSMTRLAFDQKASVTPSQSIKPSVWFPNCEWDREAELFEEVRYMKNLGMALTLLWLPS